MGESQHFKHSSSDVMRCTLLKDLSGSSSCWWLITEQQMLFYTEGATSVSSKSCDHHTKCELSPGTVFPFPDSGWTVVTRCSNRCFWVQACTALHTPVNWRWLVRARNSGFIWKANRLRRCWTPVPKNHLPWVWFQASLIWKGEGCGWLVQTS